MRDDEATNADAVQPADGQPVEGRPDLRIPGADRDDDLPEKLGERIYVDEQGVATTGSDVKPDVEIPDETM